MFLFCLFLFNHKIYAQKATNGKKHRCKKGTFSSFLIRVFYAICIRTLKFLFVFSTTCISHFLGHFKINSDKTYSKKWIQFFWGNGVKVFKIRNYLKNRYKKGLKMHKKSRCIYIAKEPREGTIFFIQNVVI